jgi:hypothetical protein
MWWVRLRDILSTLLLEEPLYFLTTTMGTARLWAIRTMGTVGHGDHGDCGLLSWHLLQYPLLRVRGQQT